MNDVPSEELLNALIDGELGQTDAAPLLAQMQVDAALRERVGQLRLQKDLVRHAYAQLAPPCELPVRPVGAQRWRSASAWALALACAALLGWTAHGLAPNAADPLLQLSRQGVHVPGTGVEHVVLHLSSGTAQDGSAALDRAEGLLGAARSAGRNLAVEIVVNSGGLDLLREGVSSHAARIGRMQRAYPDLALVACGQTAQRLRDAGIEVRLLPGVTVATSALDEVVQRLQQGWDYVKL